MKNSKCIYVVSKDEFRVINTATSVDALRKRLAIKKTTLSENNVCLRVDVSKNVLATLSTDEQEGAEILNNALLAAVVTGVEFDVAIRRLVNAKMVEVVDLEKEI